MFTKSFKIKSQTQLKGSDRKRLRSELAQSFPNLTSDDLATLVPSKEDMTMAKIYCNKGESVIVYLVQKDPIFFHIDKEKSWFPTVYSLWKHPNLLHTFTTHADVVGKLASGADLMLPGVVTQGPMSPNSYGRFEKGFPVSINLTANLAPIAVGVTFHSSMDLYMAARQGKAVSVMHVYGDHLWQMGSKGIPPDLGPPHVASSMAAESDCDGSSERAEAGEENIDGAEGEPEEESVSSIPTGDGEDINNDMELAHETLQNLILNDEEAGNGNEVGTSSGSPQQMDQLLLHCLLKSLKTSAKKLTFPVLTSNFYRLHMLPACPDGHSLDVKKSSYKKLSKFLNAMNDRGIISVIEFPKGIENVTQVNYCHEELKAFIVDENETTVRIVESGNTNSVFVPPTIEELYQVSGDTIPFFKACGLSKGDVLTTAEVRTVMTEYIKRNKLSGEKDRLVNLDPLLHGTVIGRKEGYRETLNWSEVFSRLLGKMSPAYRISKLGQETVVRKGKMEPIEISVAKRTGNKKVTLVHFIPSIYGIDENEFAHQIQVGVSASTSVGQAEHKPQGIMQVMIQGNQVAFLDKLLTETYRLPRKHIRGLELAIKGKGK